MIHETNEARFARLSALASQNGTTWEDEALKEHNAIARMLDPGRLAAGARRHAKRELDVWAKKYMQAGWVEVEASHPGDEGAFMDAFHAYAGRAAEAFETATGDAPLPGNDFWIAVLRWLGAHRDVLFGDYLPPDQQAAPGQPIPEDMEPEEPKE